MSQDTPQHPPESGRVYRTVTRYWPRIAAGLVGAVALLEWASGSTTPGFTFGFYVFAWATVTGGLWFMFDMAEKALSAEARRRVGERLSSSDFSGSIGSIPEQFATLFDRVFGEKHWSRRCFYGSFVASLASAFIAFVLLGTFAPNVLGLPVHQMIATDMVEVVGVLFLLGSISNFLPDYLSLFETRWAISRMRPRTIPSWIAIDFVATFAISVLGLAGISLLFPDLTASSYMAEWEQGPLDGPRYLLAAMLSPQGDSGLLWVFFLSAFFTSVWLWLYAASVMVSRGLVRMNSGVGFLLRVTDVEKQPFRSMGFVSVIITSVIFALGLPLVLL